MNAVEPLTLQLVHLEGGQEWHLPTQDLCLVLLEQGNGRYTSSGQVMHRLRPGDLLVLNAVRGGKVSTHGSGSLNFQFFCASLAHAYPLFGAGDLCLLLDLSNRLHTSRLHPASSPLATECHKLLANAATQSGLTHRVGLLRLVAAVLNAEINITQNRIGCLDAGKRGLRFLADVTMSELISLSTKELAAKCGCTRRHLSTMILRELGVSLPALRMELRLLKAVSLLRDPNAKITSVAEACGFNHLGLFNACFRRRFGSSPGQWRRLTGLAPYQPSALLAGNSALAMRINEVFPWIGGLHETGRPSLERNLQTSEAGEQRLSSQSAIPARIALPVSGEVIERRPVTKGAKLRRRYSELVDKKYEEGLTRTEQVELSALNADLDRIEDGFYEPILNRLMELRNKLRHQPRQQNRAV